MTANPIVVSAEQYNYIYASESDGSEVGISPQEMFDFQVHTLRRKNLDFSEEDVNRLRTFVPKRSLRFLVVPSKLSPLDLKRLMALVELDGKTGANEINSQHLTDVVKTPSIAHLLLGVDDGSTRLNIKHSVSLKTIREEKRLAYTAWYGLIHAIVFPYVLRNHHLDLCGSRHNSSGVPVLCLGSSKVPKLFSYYFDLAFPNWGAPSAGTIVG